jgi:AcrR family transcriptional regulator
VTTAETPRWRRLEPDQRREEIFACAERLFAAKPYAEVSTTEIAREARVARGLLHHYFGTKRDLYLEVVRVASTVPEIVVEDLGVGTLEERIDAAVTWFLDSLQERGGTWLAASGSHGLGRDPDLERILADAENESVDRVLDVVGLRGEREHRSELRAMIRAYGQLARAGGREWLLHDKLSREQARILLRSTLLAIVREAFPAAH